MQPPQNYAQYPRGHGGPGRPYRGPGVYLDYITESFQIVTRNAGVYVLGSLIIIAIVYAINIPVSLLSNTIAYGSPLGTPRATRLEDFLPMMAKALPISMVASIIPGAIMQTLSTGIALCAIEEADTGTTTFGTLFSGFKCFVPLIGTSFIFQILSLVGFCLCIVPFFFIAGLLCFAPIIVVKEGLGPIAAVQRSVQLLGPFWLAMGGFYFLASLVGGLGICACIVGFIFTMPVLYVCIGLHYREFRGPLNPGFQVGYPAAPPYDQPPGR
ncbi:MAG: hypothetical protein GC165_13200 [Armatimonadetes bacterium]|nr:hypothetical protein [Armatimonadota bacterium]MBS1725974.1 hypothetical protein [Armatimonadota bacterium]